MVAFKRKGEDELVLREEPWSLVTSLYIIQRKPQD